MVFHYSIRGGDCQNKHSHIHLTSDEITCYVGRDKHENEFLIKYGWPGDVWFHVEGLSSAHVYFRVTSDKAPVDGIPIDDLPLDSIYDMKQIVKHNSISGCKMASCKIVWTPHSNLKKTFEMDAGTVTYHDTKLCRYGRCDKDRQRVKELEKTKIERHNVNYYEEMKANERRLIDRKKRDRKSKLDTDLYDPVLDDLKSEKKKAGRQGDDRSGIDNGLMALEDLSFALHPNKAVDEYSNGDPPTHSERDDRPIWMLEAENRQAASSITIQFLRTRGYTAEDAASVLDQASSKEDALAKLWRLKQGSSSRSLGIPANELQEARQEETEVLRAIFGEEEEGAIFSGSEENPDKFDVILPITFYEPPDRYGLPPPLQLEVYVDNGLAKQYPYESPVLALVGGGLPERWLRELTNRLRSQTLESVQEYPGEPQIFKLITFVGEEVERILEEEAAVLEQTRKEQVEAAKAKKRAEANQRNEEETTSLPRVNYSTETERRAYAQDVLAATNLTRTANNNGTRSTNMERKRYDSGVSDQKLVEDLFG